MTSQFERPMENERWFIFGVHPSSGRVDINNGNSDVLTRVPPDLADQIVKEHNASVDRVAQRMRQELEAE